VCGEIYLPIKMNLLALQGSKIEKIKTVSSHHMALKQCEQFLQELENVVTVEMEDTALAAKQISENNLVGHAAIANSLSAELYDLEVLAEGIETNKANFTRFLVLGRTEIKNAKADKASLFLELKHETGSLVDVLNVFKQNELNLTKIQSVPILGKPYEYSFHIDLEWQDKAQFEDTLKAIEQLVQHLSVLGVYEKSTWNGMELLKTKSIIAPAKRLASVEEYYFSTKLAEITELNAAGKKVINLGVGSPDLAPSEPAIRRLQQVAAHQKSHGYQSYRGTLAFRSAISDWMKNTFDANVDPETEILPLMGSKEGIMHISMAFLDAGDEVLIPNPGYPTYTSVTKLIGGTCRYYTLKETGINFEELEKTDLSKVKLMWVNFPHMPTGTNGSIELFERLIAFGQKHKILIVNDNPYSLILNGNPLSILSIPGAKDVAIELNSLSKSHNMAGWRIGWIAGNEEIISTVLKVKSNMDSGMFLGLQEAAIEALKNDSAWHEQQNIIYAERKSIALEIIKELNCSVNPDQVGMFVWAQVPDHLSVSQLVDEILYEADVFITPGFIFGSEGQNHIRLSLCSNLETLNEALNRIKLWKLK
jgi:aspartate/methionine/tyrosine aminotransferase/prephenate dehydratase